MNTRDIILLTEYLLHRERDTSPFTSYAEAIKVAALLEQSGVSGDESASRALLTRTFGLDPNTVDVTRSACQIHDLLVDYTQALALAVPDDAADSLPGGRARLVNARGGTFLFAEEADTVQWDEPLAAEPPAQPSSRYVVIQERRHPYGPASTFPVAPDGRTGAAIEHGTVSDLVANAEQRGDHILEVGREAMDQADLAVQTLRLAELYRAVQTGEHDGRSPGVKRFDDTMAGMLIESELRKQLANALAVLDVIAPRPWLIRPDRYEPDVTIVTDANERCTCGDADLWAPADIERLNLLSVRPNAWDPTQADVDLVLRAIDTTTDHGRPWTIEQIGLWLSTEMEAALARHGWTEDDLVAVVNSLPRDEPSPPNVNAKPEAAQGFARIADLLLGPDRQAYTVDSIVAAVQQLIAERDSLRRTLASVQRERDGLAQAYAVSKENEA